MWWTRVRMMLSGMNKEESDDVDDDNDDLPKNITAQIRMFADDFILYKNMKSPRDQAKLNLNLQKNKNWRDEWQMQVNPTQNVFMYICRKKNILQTLTVLTVMNFLKLMNTHT